jgi:glycosyltransferase involved in cell wall biosynthesis
VRVLVVSNMAAAPKAPHRGRFVRDQVKAMRGAGAEAELFEWQPGRAGYRPARREIKRMLGTDSFDLVHAHYGLAGWCAALAGARPLAVTFHGTDVRHRAVGPLSRRLARRVDLVAAASLSLFRSQDGRAGLPCLPGAAVLPCGADLARFHPIPRAEARRRLDLDPDGRYALFPADPGRWVKRHDRAAEVARRSGAELLVAGSIDPEAMPDWINAANAVLVTSETEGFGLPVVEALSCGVPVLATPVGVAPTALRGVGGCLVAPFDAAAWTEALRPHLETPDPRVEGTERAEAFSASRMAERVLAAYSAVVAEK